MNLDKADLSSNITALILAGGKGRRLDGQDKGLVQVNNRPLITYVLDRIRPQVADVIISANRNNPTYAVLGYETISDSFAPGEYAGPLAGVLAGLEACTTEFMLTIPCDTPNLPENLVERMYELMHEKLVDVVTVHDGERLQPIIMLMKTSARDKLRPWLEDGHRAVQEWLSEQNSAVLQDNAADSYINLNTNDDIENFAQSLCM